MASMSCPNMADSPVAFGCVHCQQWGYPQHTHNELLVTPLAFPSSGVVGAKWHYFPSAEAHPSPGCFQTHQYRTRVPGSRGGGGRQSCEGELTDPALPGPTQLMFRVVPVPLETKYPGVEIHPESSLSPPSAIGPGHLGSFFNLKIRETESE